MHIRQYLHDKDGRLSRDGKTCLRLAERCAISPYYLYMIALGHKTPSFGLAQRIATATKGEVGLTDWRGE